MELIGIAAVIGIAVLLLKGFDRIAGRGPTQVKEGVRSARREDHVEEERFPCPHCAEKILPAAKKCPHCKTELTTDTP